MLTNDEALQISRTPAPAGRPFPAGVGLPQRRLSGKVPGAAVPPLVERLCAEIAERFAGDEVQVVVGPTTGGVLLAYEVAKHLGMRGIFAERGDDGKGRVLRRGFEIREGENVLLVDDILTTGGSVRDTMEVVEATGQLDRHRRSGRPQRRHRGLRRPAGSPARWTSTSSPPTPFPTGSPPSR